MKRDLEVEALLQAWRDAPIPLAGADETAAQRARVLPTLRALVVEEAERSQSTGRMSPLGWGLGALAMAAGITLFVVNQSAGTNDVVAASGAEHGQVSLHVTGGRAVLSTPNQDVADVSLDSSIPSRGELAVSDSATLRTPQGVVVGLGAGTRVKLDDVAASQGSTRLGLVAGRVHCNVPHLGKRGSFSVRTPSAEVVVHGTVFTVDTEAAEAGGTCVRVTEGLVEVRSRGKQHMVAGGQSWGCQSELEEVAGAAETRDERRDGLRARRRAAPSLRLPGAAESLPEPAEAPPSALAEQSTLLAEALSAERRGQSNRARALYRKLLREHTDSPLAPEARRGLQRLK